MELSNVSVFTNDSSWSYVRENISMLVLAGIVGAVVFSLAMSPQMRRSSTQASSSPE